MLCTKQQFNHTQNNILTLKNNDITLLSTKQNYYTQNNNIARYGIKLKHQQQYSNFNIIIQHNKTQNKVRKNRQHCKKTKQYNKKQIMVIK